MEEQSLETVHHALVSPDSELMTKHRHHPNQSPWTSIGRLSTINRSRCRVNGDDVGLHIHVSRGLLTCMYISTLSSSGTAGSNSTSSLPTPDTNRTAFGLSNGNRVDEKHRDTQNRRLSDYFASRVSFQRKRPPKSPTFSDIVPPYTGRQFHWLENVPGVYTAARPRKLRSPRTERSMH